VPGCVHIRSQWAYTRGQALHKQKAGRGHCNPPFQGGACVGVFRSRVVSHFKWQCPQGGYDEHADKGSKVNGVWREVWEEVGLKPQHGLELVGQLDKELQYETEAGAHSHRGYHQRSLNVCRRPHVCAFFNQAKHDMVSILLGRR